MPDSHDAASRQWDHDFRRLRQAYRGKLGKELATLGAALREARQSPSAYADRDTLRRVAHRLKGTSGTYGFEECCAALERVEAGLARVVELAATDAEDTWSEIELALRTARASLL